MVIDPEQEAVMPLAFAVLAYEAARAEGRAGSAEYNAAAKLLADVSQERQTFWRVQLATIRERYGS